MQWIYNFTYHALDPFSEQVVTDMSHKSTINVQIFALSSLNSHLQMS